MKAEMKGHDCKEETQNAQRRGTEPIGGLRLDGYRQSRKSSLVLELMRYRTVSNASHLVC